jgi:hypothetical protein
MMRCVGSPSTHCCGRGNMLCRELDSRSLGGHTASVLAALVFSVSDQ